VNSLAPMLDVSFSAKDAPMDNTPAPIQATAQALAALDRLRDAHGEILLHLPTGCCNAGAPMCFAQSEFRIGARDVLLGTVAGVPIYEMRETATCPLTAPRLLDIEPGRAAGFSLNLEDGTRLVLR